MHTMIPVALPRSVSWTYRFLPLDRDPKPPPRCARSLGYPGDETRWTQAVTSNLHRDDECGFTLLETLVALVVVGLLMVTLTQGVRVGLQAWAIEGRIGGDGIGIETTDRMLRELISRASPGETVAPQSPFIGAAHTLSFVTFLPDESGAVTTLEADVTLLVAGGRLELRWRPHYRRWIATKTMPVSSVILDGVASIDIAYWQPGSGPEKGAWLSAWTGRYLPALVRLHVVFDPHDARRWPDIIAAPMQQRAWP
jgi:general secretion pathway protein J